MNRERLIELQKTADEAKYLKGWEEQYDPSGNMPFCDYCKYKSLSRCIIQYSERTENLVCGKAYAKYISAELANILDNKN